MRLIAGKATHAPDPSVRRGIRPLSRAALFSDSKGVASNTRCARAQRIPVACSMLIGPPPQDLPNRSTLKTGAGQPLRADKRAAKCAGAAKLRPRSELSAASWISSQRALATSTLTSRCALCGATCSWYCCCCCCCCERRRCRRPRCCCRRHRRALACARATQALKGGGWRRESWSENDRRP